MSVNVSIGIKKGVYCILLMNNGKLISKTINKFKDTETINSTYLSTIEAFNNAFRIVRNYLNTDNSCKEFVFETSNSIFIKWIDNQYSKEMYQDKFIGVLTMLNELPIRYRLVYNQKPLAVNYIKDYKDEGIKLSGLDIDSVEEV